MEKENSIKLFGEKSIRSVWDEAEEEWYFSLVDVVDTHTDSSNPTDYLKKLRKRDHFLGNYIWTNCPQVAMVTETGKYRKTAKKFIRGWKMMLSIISPHSYLFGYIQSFSFEIAECD